MRTYKYFFIAACFACLVSMPVTGYGQSGTTLNSKVAQKHAGPVAKQCLGQWKKQSCLKAVSRSALVLASNYAGRLQKQGHGDAVEQIKNKCAAATAATRGEYKADVMRSAYAECANTILEVSNTTGLEPDQSHYQLLVGPVLCIRGDRRCAAIERGLRQYQ